MDTRFKSLKNLKFLELLNSNKFNRCQKIFKIEAFESLKQLYGSFFDIVKLKNELTVFYSHSHFNQISINEIPGILLNLD